jgi:hypothetical protein
MPATNWSRVFCLSIHCPKTQRLNIHNLQFYWLFSMDVKLVLSWVRTDSRVMRKTFLHKREEGTKEWREMC